MKYCIAPVTPTEQQQRDGYNVIPTCQPIAVYTAMLSAAPPFEWPEEAVEAAAKAYCNANPYAPDASAPVSRGMEQMQAWESRAQYIRAALNAALKVLEGRDG